MTSRNQTFKKPDCCQFVHALSYPYFLGAPLECVGRCWSEMEYVNIFVVVSSLQLYAVYITILSFPQALQDMVSCYSHSLNCLLFFLSQKEVKFCCKYTAMAISTITNRMRTMTAIWVSLGWKSVNFLAHCENFLFRAQPMREEPNE